MVSCAGLLKTLCRDEIGDTAAAELEYVRSVITRHSEQAVTEDLVTALRRAREYIADDVRRQPSDYDPRVDLAFVDEALKAAMEAGR